MELSIVWDIKSVWQDFAPQNKCDLYFMVQWFCPLSYELFDGWTSYFGIISQCDLTFDLIINVGHIDLYFMIRWFYPISWRLYMLQDNVTVWNNIWAASWKTNKMAFAPSEDSDQPQLPPSLIRVFFISMKNPWILSYSLSAQRRLRSAWAADLSFAGCSHFVGFCHEAAHLPPNHATCCCLTGAIQASYAVMWQLLFGTCCCFL